MSGMASFDDRELQALAVDLGKLATSQLTPVRDAFEAGALDLKNKWRENATQTAGKHGRRYPASISYDEVGLTSIAFEVGPETNRPQGGMGPGFEYGSKNQPPHLDGQRAADEIVPHLQRRILLAAEDVFRDA